MIPGASIDPPTERSAEDRERASEVSDPSQSSESGSRVGTPKPAPPHIGSSPTGPGPIILTQSNSESSTLGRDGFAIRPMPPISSYGLDPSTSATKVNPVHFPPSRKSESSSRP